MKLPIKEIFTRDPVRVDNVPGTWFRKEKLIGLWWEDGYTYLQTKNNVHATPDSNVTTFIVDATPAPAKVEPKAEAKQGGK